MLRVTNCDNAKFRQHLRQNVKTLLKDLSSDSPIKKTIAVAALNALSQTCYECSVGPYATKFKANPF
nr:DUF4213 domain-containing proteins [uncultured Campylobacter sp.]